MLTTNYINMSDPDSELTVMCKLCRAVMSNPDFDDHLCPGLVPPRQGESWDDYMVRCAKENLKRNED